MASQSQLHVIEPLGFEITDKQLRRAGLDYWPKLEFFKHKDFDSWLELVSDPKRMFFFSTKAQRNLDEIGFLPGDWMIFGKETKGLDEGLLGEYPDQVVKIPMPGEVRSLNLANAVAISVFEGLRQIRQTAGRHPQQEGIS